MLPVVVLSISLQQEVYSARALLDLKQRQLKLDLEAYITGLKTICYKVSPVKAQKI